MGDGEWHVWIDTGGTFTDCVGVHPSGTVHRTKVLSSARLRGRLTERIGDCAYRVEHSWPGVDDIVRGLLVAPLDPESPGPGALIEAFCATRGVIELDQPLNLPTELPLTIELQSREEAPILAARLMTGTRLDQPLPAMQMRLATTRGTNALLQRGGGPTALIVTKGFADLLLIGDQQRPELFALTIRRPEPVYSCAVEIDGRLRADGTEMTPIDAQQVLEQARRLLARGINNAAVALLHSYRNPDHERQVAEVLQEAGVRSVTCSVDCAPLIGIVSRAQTAVVNAYLDPVIEAYVQRVRRSVPPASSLHMMTSAGGLVRSDRFMPKDALLSGPAGGVAGAAAAGCACGFNRLIGFDMGGTSTDVCRFDGDFDYRYEQHVGDARIMAPALAIETVAAGGGSICGFHDDRLFVGPHSAGADPGPACYGAGGPLTVTDVNVLLGRVNPDRFEIPLSVDAARQALGTLLEKIEQARGKRPGAENILAGLIEIANERMAAAIAQVSLRKGYDPRDYALVAFGGAGGQHACAVARRLGIRTVVLPSDASLLSAIGLGRAVIERIAQRQILRPLSAVDKQLPALFADLAHEASERLREECPQNEAVSIRRRIISLRLLGQDATIEIDVGTDLASLSGTFAQRYLAMYGHEPQDRPIEVESLRVVASTCQSDHIMPPTPQDRPPDSEARSRRVFVDGSWHTVPGWERSQLSAGMTIAGAAIVFEQNSVLLIEHDWKATVDTTGAIILRADEHAAARGGRASRDAVVEAELLTNRLKTMTEEAGHILQRTALSTNVKERLDFSCTLLDADGYLVVNAPHMPVHLGAMGLCVRSLRERVAMCPGDVVVTNHPRDGGSHLPDVTVVSPIFFDGALLGYFASRAHHAEIGGCRPGSMPPHADTLVDEGVIIEPQYLIEQGESRFDAMEHLLRHSDWPSRAVPDNLADLRAQVASNQHAAGALVDLAREWGPDRVAAHMRSLRHRAEGVTRRALRELPDAVMIAEERLDDGSPIHVRVTKEGDHAVIDFEGSAPVHPGNLNATPAIVRSAVLYVLRLLVDRLDVDLPLNEGVMEAVDVRIPEGMLNPRFPNDPRECPAVVGGNVETSQRLVDTLIKAFGIAACSQGTMNNTLFGNERFSYYETVCGGSGATPDGPGVDGVHTHMTNTRITDPEVLEHRYPVRLRRFAIRCGSGGEGRHRGGDGVIREIEFLEDVQLSVLSQHRVEAPFGAGGGACGRRGEQTITAPQSEPEPLDSIDGADVSAGARFTLKTPGGGGWGAPE